MKKKYLIMFTLVIIFIIVLIVKRGPGLWRQNGQTSPLVLPGQIVFQTDRIKSVSEEVNIPSAIFPEPFKDVVEAVQSQSIFLLENGKMRKIADGTDPRLSRDGSKVIYSERNGVIRILDLSNNQTTALEWAKKYLPSEFDLSPDQQWITFTSDEVQFSRCKVPQHNLFIARIDGTNVKQLTDARDGIYHLQFSPDGKAILFSVRQDPVTDEPGGLYVIHLESLELKRIFGPFGGTMDCRWSPTGNLIVFSKSDGHNLSNIYIVNADGSQIRKITNFRRNCANRDPAFSPDGTQILFVSYRHTSPVFGSELFIVNIDGTNEQRVTPPQRIKKYGRWRLATDTYPDWAP